jgi:hypothetical protein
MGTFASEDANSANLLMIDQLAPGTGHDRVQLADDVLRQRRRFVGVTAEFASSDANGYFRI